MKAIKYDYELITRTAQIDAGVLRHVRQQVSAGAVTISLEGFLQLHLDAIADQLAMAENGTSI